jgi:hypothetical protein
MCESGSWRCGHVAGLHRHDPLSCPLFKQPVQNPLLLRFRFWQPEMPADGSLQLFFIDITALHDKRISDHDGRGFREPQFGVFFGAILLEGFGSGFDFQVIFFPQPGDYFSEMLSRLAAGLI